MKNKCNTSKLQTSSRVLYVHTLFIDAIVMLDEIYPSYTVLSLYSVAWRSGWSILLVNGQS